MTLNAEIIMDEERRSRVGVDEAVLCEQKSPEQITQIVRSSIELQKRRLFTRISYDKFLSLPQDIQSDLKFDGVSRTAVLGSDAHCEGKPKVAIVSGGSSDAPVVAEAQTTLAFHGIPSLIISDVGVAGLWRLMSRVDEIAEIPIVLAVAGMDAALPTVLSGLVPSVVIGVPCSTGYGASHHGQTALNAMLASCAPGLTVTNIDNGYGAACAAIRVANMLNLAAHPGD